MFVVKNSLTKKQTEYEVSLAPLAQLTCGCWKSKASSGKKRTWRRFDPKVQQIPKRRRIHEIQIQSKIGLGVPCTHFSINLTTSETGCYKSRSSCERKKVICGTPRETALLGMVVGLGPDPYPLDTTQLKGLGSTKWDLMLWVLSWTRFGSGSEKLRPIPDEIWDALKTR